MIEVYAVPLAGTVDNWYSFSGNTNDPIRPLGPYECAEQIHYAGPLMVELLSVDMEEMLGVVRVTADRRFHAAFKRWGQAPDNIAKKAGKARLRRPPGVVVGVKW